MRSKRLMHTNTSFARRAGFLQCICDSFNLAMTVKMNVIRFVRSSDDRRGGCFLFVRRSDDRRDGCYPIRPTYQCLQWWMLSDLSNVAMTVLFVSLYWLVTWRIRLKDAIFRVSFLWRSDVPIGPYCRSVFRVLPRSSFDVLLRLSVRFLPWTVSLMMINT